MKTKLCLLYGGKSAEHQVSLQTAKAVIQALDLNKFDIYPIYIATSGEWIKGAQLSAPVADVAALKYEQVDAATFNFLTDVGEYDVVFPLLHGPNGEDGTVQGLLEVLNVPYVGNGVLASSAGMDKVVMKNIFAQAGLDQVDYTWFIRSTWEEDKEAVYEQVEKKLGYPCFVKPANLGSSVGISKCENRTELMEAFVEAFRYDRRIIIEEGVDGREIEVGVIGNDEAKCSVAGEIVPKTAFYDYQAKYEDGNTALIIPADIPAETYEKMKEISITAYKALDCAGLVRSDFFVTKDNRVLMNEVNTMPGFTPSSMFPLLWKETGIAYPALIEQLVALAIERYEEKQRIIHTF